MKTVNESLYQPKQTDEEREAVRAVRDALAEEDAAAQVRDLKRPGRQPRLTGETNGQ